MSTRFRITLLIYGMINAVIFGFGIILVLSFPEISEAWPYIIPVVVVASFVLAAPVAWIIAPSLRARNRPDR